VLIILKEERDQPVLQMHIKRDLQQGVWQTTIRLEAHRKRGFYFVRLFLAEGISMYVSYARGNHVTIGTQINDRHIYRTCRPDVRSMLVCGEYKTTPALRQMAGYRRSLWPRGYRHPRS